MQTGIGRTGFLFGYEMLGVTPDIFTLAKALGGGIPIGAVCASDRVSAAFAPGDHGSTFGGNPLATAAGLAVLQTVLSERIPDKVKEVSAHMRAGLEALKQTSGKIAEIRNAGHMYAVEFTEPVAPAIRNCLFEKGWLVGNVGTSVLRILPPLIIEKEDADAFVRVLAETPEKGRA